MLLVQIFGAVMVLFMLVCACVMKLRNTPERKEFNKRFVRIAEWCDANPGFVWLPGKDSPEGFTGYGILR